MRICVYIRTYLIEHIYVNGRMNFCMHEYEWEIHLCILVGKNVNEWMYVCMYVRMHVRMCKNLCINENDRTFVCMYVFFYICMYVNERMCVCE